ncbi:Dolichyl-diphosphooligosaccharide--protein glycosyltransferase subunit DAD1 [Gracilariopsis chorda]|uniref:Dolichyl-diphosphooligosaccharide--protein glycosyltransferase subunit OST2 n=1 Tax=Gracilariopsis chorda TaxID=448386 RepID=A0A2V3IVJ0_9FLOR|nr:Dolichyl-diphosphooligosaccharide--protein glycosyltransferase subunit DAD1 [Gracilariopsis chorda]|eukprot:PXF46131.1 Dolichyl-diphosphooligosaccharide--protein glycosyltransferase subunit DAD1 [Gracilariopsis chorda]
MSASGSSVLQDVFHAYKQNVSRELQAIDMFLGYVLVTGIVQMVYMLCAGSFPYNSFLAGFLCSVGVFVLTVSLRMQVNPVNTANALNRWTKLSKRRAYMHWLFCNLILHMAVLNFAG